MENREFRVNKDKGYIEQWKGGEWIRSSVNDIPPYKQHGTWTETTNDSNLMVFKKTGVSE